MPFLLTPKLKVILINVNISFEFQKKEKLLKVFYETATSFPKPEDTPPRPPPPPVPVLQQLEKLSLNDSSDSVIRAQSLLIQYFKSFHKKQMPEIVKQTLATVNDNVQNIGIENEEPEPNGKILLIFKVGLILAILPKIRLYSQFSILTTRTY